MKRIFYVIFMVTGLVPFSLTAGTAKIPAQGQLYSGQPSTFWVVGFPGGNGLYFENLKTGERIELSPSRGFVSVGKQGGWLGFKWVARGEAAFPVLFHTGNGRAQILPTRSHQVGTPSFSKMGTIAYSDGNEIVLADSNGTVWKRIEIPTYANWTPISPNGRWVAYNDGDDQIWVVSVQNPAKRIKLTDGRHAYFHPIWNGLSSRLLIQSVDGKIFLSRIEPFSLKKIAEGTHPVWAPDGRTIAFEHPHWGTGGLISDWDIAVYDVANQRVRFLTRTPNVAESSPIFLSNRTVAFWAGATNLVKVNLNDRKQTVRLQTVLPSLSASPLFPKKRRVFLPTVERQTAAIDIPYVHQVYDTPDWFDGYWACGATSAIMIIAHYPILPEWPLYVGQPSGHRTYFGRYICYAYSTHRHTFNIWSYDRLGHKGYGGYGFITQKNWADTKGFMAKYFRYHGLSSSVDWSPTWNELRQEIDEERPFVLLNSLTTAGHYIDVVGYFGDRSVIVNDPYGDKNRGYTNYYGKQAVYDWPGYNNGNANLNTVWCFINAHPAVDWQADALNAPDTLSLAQSFSASFELSNEGLVDGDSVTVALYFSPDMPISNRDAMIASQPVPPLASSDTLSFTLNATAPDSLSSRVLYLGVLVNPLGNGQEADRDNNYFSLPVVLKGLPTISRVQPQAGAVVSQNPLTLEAYYSDNVVGIDSSAVQLFLNGKDVTSGCEISGNRIRYVAQNVTSGPYRARVMVKNRAGFSREKSWAFSVDLSSVVAEERDAAPGHFALFQNSPNPFKASHGTVIWFQLAQEKPVEITIYNVRGERVKSWYFSSLASGKQHIFWNGRGEEGSRLASGFYFVNFRAGSFAASRRIVLLK